MEAAQVPTSKWVDETTMGYLHNGILLSCKKEENCTLWDSMDGPKEHYAKWNKPVRQDKYHMISLICGIWWANWSNSWNRGGLIGREQMTAMVGLGGGGIEQTGKGLMDMDNSVMIVRGRGV